MNLLFLIPISPLIGFLLLTYPKWKNNKTYSTSIGIGSIGISAIINAWVGIKFLLLNNEKEKIYFKQHLWDWISLDKFNITITLHLDGLSFTMMSIIVNIGFIILLYSTWYMNMNKDYACFFSYTNLFMSNMIFLVLVDNLLSMYFFWEIVGFCSYLLIGFYNKIPKNGTAAIKSFITTRISDIFLLLSLLLIYTQLETLNFHNLSQLDEKNSPIIKISISILLLIGAIGKSAQFPFHTWLTSAMVGPTPVSALIHATTMVTSGIYLIARTHEIFINTPKILNILCILSIITILISGTSALTQKNIKKILAYSTISQLGYIFLSLSIQAWHAAIFHLMIHSFFKALLFLSSGALILACNHEQNIFKMGGLQKTLPLIYISFMIGSSALTGIPWISSGFYSKEQIFHFILQHNNILILGEILGTLLTTMYTFRMIFIIFYGKSKIIPKNKKNIFCNFSLFILSILSTFIGSYITPPLKEIFPKNNQEIPINIFQVQWIYGTLIIIGSYFITKFWIEKKHTLKDFKKLMKLQNSISSFFYQGWKLNLIYEYILQRPYYKIIQYVSKDPINKYFETYLIIIINYITHIFLNIENNKKIYKWYIPSIGINIILIITFLFFLSDYTKLK
ncbi:NADH-quinone oxidoreductase subunit L [Candidatus Westeberhardia cardiocondylae]|uniref:NADH-quinone oxidoreductase subunit L n=1 Tax=Candidatus Westeberhardia cardiocondylae TaxID=1594731 RepID=A0A0H5BX78_9ENTR|nr:NADH-quinone oxidoreductase subunit L [Candidatus Westeberhardia cardiocondylae]CEN32328.1 NADH-quinone oxidoreductase subunit L [Candidatus Westeberhardia cardiocondylae]